MVADRFDDGVYAAVADTKSFTGHAADVHLAGRGAVERDVADDNVLFRHERGALGRVNYDLATAEPFAYVVVGVTLEGECHALGHERAKTLAGAAFEMQFDGVLGQA